MHLLIKLLVFVDVSYFCQGDDETGLKLSSM